jgi:hypothetical protein
MILIKAFTKTASDREWAAVQGLATGRHRAEVTKDRVNWLAGVRRQFLKVVEARLFVEFRSVDSIIVMAELLKALM